MSAYNFPPLHTGEDLKSVRETAPTAPTQIDLAKSKQPPRAESLCDDASLTARCKFKHWLSGVGARWAHHPHAEQQKRPLCKPAGTWHHNNSIFSPLLLYQSIGGSVTVTTLLWSLSRGLLWFSRPAASGFRWALCSLSVGKVLFYPLRPVWACQPIEQSPTRSWCLPSFSRELSPTEAAVRQTEGLDTDTSSTWSCGELLKDGKFTTWTSCTYIHVNSVILEDFL